jgi:hypothetical protein
MHSYIPIYCFEVRGAIGFQTPFKLRCVKLEQCCYMASFDIFLPMLSSLTYLGGKVGHREIRIWL